MAYPSRKTHQPNAQTRPTTIGSLMASDHGTTDRLSAHHRRAFDHFEPGLSLTTPRSSPFITSATAQPPEQAPYDPAAPPMAAVDDGGHVGLELHVTAHEVADVQVDDVFGVVLDGADADR